MQHIHTGRSASRRMSRCYLAAGLLMEGPGVYPHIRAVSDGSHFFSFREARSDAYRVSASDERQRNGEKWPRPFGFHPNAQKRRVWGPGLRRKLGHTALSASTLEPPKPSASALSGPIYSRNADYPYMWIHPSGNAEGEREIGASGPEEVGGPHDLVRSCTGRDF
jgi:hypothetical protein